ncbi:MAG TPA: DUF554 domain-containing protein [Halanaerobiaceae bacterium]|jgi:uncharacterized membrane protein YqgA involved in biofilm formation|nr:DUF554 domain-containing protein [Bacillota bacterium]HHU91886.1 DUF554 domain-containing protein [Halanaerobiaceae bacterium]HOA40787.1 DUF554 domain-containing protein [Halanaerobiales bacterium]HPZ62993.1 DUF554 domain-containing protein [Halanaerobiales bacterium]HQD04198.1 DUF554 domain-containing protein [Halanaerobiales bacterium]
MTGTIVNFFAIIVGALLGVFLKERFSQKLQEIVMQGLGLAVVLIGLQMALESKNLLIIIFSLVLGGITGELIDIEKKLNSLGAYIQNKFGREDDLFIQGFVQASLVFCVGAMAIMGAIHDGINNDPTILFNKSILDGFASIAFAAATGIGVLFSAFPVLLYQGGISLLAAFIARFLTEAVIVEMTATGGLLILAIGLNLMKVSKIKVGNLLPSLLYAIILSFFIV